MFFSPQSSKCARKAKTQKVEHLHFRSGGGVDYLNIVKTSEFGQHFKEIHSLKVSYTIFTRILDTISPLYDIISSKGGVFLQILFSRATSRAHH